jgi:vancomycin resistance protein VanW
METLKPKYRSPLRIRLGIAYYRFRRYLDWWLDNKAYSRHKAATMLPHVIYRHQSPLLRKLSNVDMWMQHNKITNLRLAVQQMNGLLIQPGETFSYWRTIGRTSRRKGYVDGMVLFHGQVRAGVGGGLCQLSNLIYWMTLHSPLTVTERYRHSYDVFPDSGRSQPFGSGATCYYNYLDLQITNTTSQVYQLHVRLSDTHLIGEWRCSSPAVYSYQVYEKEHWITQELWGGYVRHNTIWRKAFTLEGEELADEFITENHAIMMYEPMLAEKSVDGEPEAQYSKQ